MTATAAPDVIPLYGHDQPFYVPAFEIWLGNNRMAPDVVRDVVEVTYEDSLDKIDSFTLVLNNWEAQPPRRHKYYGLPVKPADGTPEHKLAHLLAPGTNVAVKLGYLGAGRDMRTMLTGHVTSVDLELTETQSSRVVVRGVNVLDRFRTKQFTWAWPETGTGTIRDSDIAKSLERAADEKAGRPGLGFPVRIDQNARDAEVGEPHVLMNNQYAILFLLERARRRGYSVFVGRDTDADGKPVGDDYLWFGPSDRLLDRTYLLEWGRSLVSFKAAISTGAQVSKVVVVGWDPKTKKPIREEAAVGTKGLDLKPELAAVAHTVNREEVVDSPPARTTAEAKERAAQLLKNQQRQLLTATAVTVGLPDLRAGRYVEIGGVDWRIDGRYFVTSTTHTLNDTGYRTQFTCRHEPAPAGAPSGGG